MQIYKQYEIPCKCKRKNVDVWLIYRCEKCSTSWNMANYERSAVHDISGKEYEEFLSNDRGMAERLGRRADLFARNRVETVTETGAYQVEIEGISYIKEK